MIQSMELIDEKQLKFRIVDSGGKQYTGYLKAWQETAQAFPSLREMDFTILLIEEKVEEDTSQNFDDENYKWQE